MKKRFNTTGVCFPSEHYMADTSAKYAKIRALIERGDYFTINRPRQYGKTTALAQLQSILNKTDEFYVIRMSFEGFGDSLFNEEALFCSSFVNELLYKIGRAKKEGLEAAVSQELPSVWNLKALSLYLSQFIQMQPYKLVLMIDEVDKSSNNQLFVSFLGMLRDKYLARHEEPTFHSVILCGIYDVKSLKLKLRPEEEKKFNSPWNIAIIFKVDMNFSPQEIRPMLESYAHDTGVKVESEEVAERIFYYTSGYPFLVSKLCCIVDEEILPESNSLTWTVQEIDEAVGILLRESNVNFDELIKNLRNNPGLYELVDRLLIEGHDFTFDPNADTIKLGTIHGIFSSNNNRLTIHNRIYREFIYNYMSANAELESPWAGRFFADAYVLPNQQLNLKQALLKFQELLKAEYHTKDRDFLEREGRLVFLAFLKPILNGRGYAFKEPQISEEKRLDILITYYQHRYLIELKVWRGKQAHENGLNQLVDYLNRVGLDEGALLVFDHKEQNQWKNEAIDWKGKRIFVVWV
jgi:AAA-like domain